MGRIQRIRIEMQLVADEERALDKEMRAIEEHLKYSFAAAIADEDDAQHEYERWLHLLDDQRYAVHDEEY